MANTTLHQYIEILLALELDLLNNPSRADEIFKAQIIVNFEPSLIQDFFSLIDPSATIDSNPLQGVLQICAITSLKEVPFDSFSTEDVKRFREEEVLLRKEPVHLGVVQWVRYAGESLDISNSLVIITKESTELARQTTDLEIPTFPRKGTNSIVKKPVSKMGYIEFVSVYSFPPWILILILGQIDKCTHSPGYQKPMAFTN